MPSTSNLISYLTCLVYVPYLGKLQVPKNHKLIDKGTPFYRATAMLSAVYAVVVCLCVCLSVCNTPVLYQNG